MIDFSFDIKRDILLTLISKLIKCSVHVLQRQLSLKNSNLKSPFSLAFKLLNNNNNNNNNQFSFDPKTGRLYLIQRNKQELLDNLPKINQQLLEFEVSDGHFSDNLKIQIKIVNDDVKILEDELVSKKFDNKKSDVSDNDDDEDLNIHKPSVAKIHKFSIQEGDYNSNNRKLVGKIEVFDLDYDENYNFRKSKDSKKSSDPAFSYSMGSSKNSKDLPFTLDEMTGQIHATESINYETKKFYEFIVYVSDFKFEVNTTVRITVTDLNECSPKFEKEVYRVDHIYENQKGPKVILNSIRAKDCDLNQELDYTIISNPPMIADQIYIDYKNFSLMTTENFDREKMPNFTLSVTAIDTFNKVGTTQIVVMIQDINDNKPFIKNMPNTVKISESIPKGEIFYSVNAVDMDGPQTRFIYKFCQDSWIEYFSIDYKYGSISVRKELGDLDKSQLDIPIELDICVYDNDHNEGRGKLRNFSSFYLFVFLNHNFF